jgi:hypothetical protein
MCSCAQPEPKEEEKKKEEELDKIEEDKKMQKEKKIPYSFLPREPRFVFLPPFALCSTLLTVSFPVVPTLLLCASSYGVVFQILKFVILLFCCLVCCRVFVIHATFISSSFFFVVGGCSHLHHGGLPETVQRQIYIKVCC